MDLEIKISKKGMPMPARVVLYVEDNRVNLLLVKKIFSMMSGFRLVTAMDGKSGLEMVTSENPDIIILDINMPIMDGFEVLKLLRADKKHKNTPILALTSNASNADVELGLERGFTSYVTKPVDIAELKNTLSEVTHK